MAKRWYGSLDNRIEENRLYCDKIEVGTGATIYSWSDRHPYEVIDVKDQKHVTIREMEHRRKAGAIDYSNDWDLLSDESKPHIDVVKRGKYWYQTTTITPEEAKRIIDENDIDGRIWACQNDFILDDVILSGKNKTKYHRINISFGVCEYYYDYSF